MPEHARGLLRHHEVLPVEFWPEHTARAYRMLYAGLGYHGGPRDVTGMALVPDAPVPAEGLPIVGYAHGTTGLGDDSAPSRVGFTRLERGHVARWLAAGYIVAVTDYEGLSTPGPHPYLNGEAVADDVVDAVRAARQLGVPTTGGWVVAGFSQGGHAALFVGLMATRYAPELDFRGTVALAPPVHMPMLIGAVTTDGSRPVSILTSYLLAGLPISHPDFDPRALLTDEGDRLVELAATAPLVEVLRAGRGLTNDRVGTTNLHDRAGMHALLDTCRVPVARFDRPVLLSAGGADEVVPLEVVERFADDLRATGTDVEFVCHEGANHGAVLTADVDALTSWAAALLAAPAPTSSQTPAGARDSRFSLLDATGDGYVTRDDYEAFALRLVQAFGQPPGSPAAVAVREGYRRLWRTLADRAETDRDGQITEAEFLTWIGAVSTDDGFDDEIAPLAQAVVALADDDTDGALTERELECLLAACGLSSAQAQRVFAELDLNANASIDTTELVAAIRAFCLNPAAHQPGAWLFGAI
ncbi:MAG TPA: lipase family protein [Solirubrobacteraceae bacterium]|jgi:predicted esterase/Ca2+-binding EF-hand superfamily protein|nr:lipase family protein [Solirubrobacteraceae bacterium]